MRPLYEAKRDLVNEIEVINKVCFAWSCEAQKMPISYNLDFALIRNGQVAAYAEIKTRSNARQKYPTAFIALKKVISAKQFGLPCFLIMQWADELGYTRLDRAPDFISMGGRIDRLDSADIEPMAHFKQGDFKKID